MSVKMMSTIYTVADKWIHLVRLRLILSEIILGYNLIFRSCIAAFMFIINLMFDIIISLRSAILVVGYSFVMIINIPYFQHYSHQICNLLFSKLCWHNRHRPNRNSIHSHWQINVQSTLVTLCLPTSYVSIAAYIYSY